MADNYLEKRQEELAQYQKKVVRRNNPSLDSLLHRNRSYRGFDPAREVTQEELKTLLSVVPLTASAMNEGTSNRAGSLNSFQPARPAFCPSEIPARRRSSSMGSRTASG